MEKAGLVKGIPADADLEGLKESAITPCKIQKVSKLAWRVQSQGTIGIAILEGLY